MNYLEDIASDLTAASLGTLGTDLFLNRIPTGRSDVAVLMLYGGPAPWHTAGEGNNFIHERPRVQVVAVGSNNTTAWTRIKALYDHLLFRANIVINNIKYSFRPLQQPFYGGRDENENVKFIFNIEVQLIRCVARA